MDFEDEEEEEGEHKKQKGPKFPLTMYISEGIKYYNLHLFQKAIVSFNSALEKEPQSVESLIGRAKCFRRVGRLSDAKKDAEDALAVYSRSPEAKMLKAETEYLLGDFESSFLEYSRGRVSRPNYGAFRLGEQMCRRAIDNALGTEQDILLDTEDVAEVSGHLQTRPQDRTDIEAPKTVKITKLYSEDVKCLRILLSDQTMESVHPECSELLEFIKDRQRFWRYQNPSSQGRARYDISWDDLGTTATGSSGSWYSEPTEDGTETENNYGETEKSDDGTEKSEDQTTMSLTEEMKSEKDSQSSGSVATSTEVDSNQDES